MRAGRLRNRIRIKNPSSTDGGSGIHPVTWPTDAQDDGEVWACVEPLSQRELFWASQQGSIATHKITCRYTDAITPKTRLTFGSRTFHVVSAIADRKMRELEITAAEKTV